MRHFWFGEWIDDTTLDAALSTLETRLAATLPQRFPLDDLLDAAQALSDALDPGGSLYARFLALVRQTQPLDEARRLLVAARGALTREALLGKLRGELGQASPGAIERRYPARPFEGWLPMGAVVHVMPANVFLVSALGLVEGLLVGNVNLVKLSARDSLFAAEFAAALCERDPGGRLRDYMAVLHLASAEHTRLATLFAQADAVSAWGGESAMAAVRAAVPQGVRLVSWGHKLSFAYVSREALDCAETFAKAVEGVAIDMCRLDQQACSSPQTVFIESDEAGVERFADALAHALERIAPQWPGQAPEGAALAEITTVLSVARAEQALGLTRVIEDAEGGWRLLVDHRPGLRPSPLYRTLWIKAMRREEMVSTLRPMRTWLQTCGLASTREALGPLSRALFAAGVTRIARPGEMVDSYTGAPHDGVYALMQLTRRVSLDAPEASMGVGRLDELEAPLAHPALRGPILDKAGFQAHTDALATADLVFRSGGSSGKTVYSTFSWADYHAQMRAAAHGLVAAGLEPERDRVMNLFAAGHLYGSFISFWSILETLRARQLPMGLLADFAEIADAIVSLQANALVGAPSHLLGLFEQEGERLRGVVEKIFYAGEPLTRAQRARLTETFGVRVLRSAAYGSNDAGPMGYQCPYCEGSVHHLLGSVQQLEIVALDEDRPVAPGEVGRLLFTTSPRLRGAPALRRYEIGDTGRWLDTPCPCGRRDPRFELTGRIGDAFKAGGPFFNARRFFDILDQQLGYAGPAQIHLRDDEARSVVELRIAEGAGLSAAQAAEAVRLHYPEVRYCETQGMAFRFEVRLVDASGFQRVAASGKLPPVIDSRAIGEG